jgi:hypothetical protein
MIIKIEWSKSYSLRASLGAQKIKLSLREMGSWSFQSRVPTLELVKQVKADFLSAFLIGISCTIKA